MLVCIAADYMYEYMYPSSISPTSGSSRTFGCDEKRLNVLFVLFDPFSISTLGTKYPRGGFRKPCLKDRIKK